MAVNPADVENIPEVDTGNELRPCSFCGEPKNVRVTPDGDGRNPIGICNDCAVRAVVVLHNYLVDYSKSLIKSNEALKLALASATSRVN